MEHTKQKTEGRVFTPQHIVEQMLDKTNLAGENLLSQKIMEPSCGDGAFIVAVLDRMIRYAEESGQIDRLKYAIKNNVFGIEKDPAVFEDLRSNVLNLFRARGLDIPFPSNIRCANTISEYKQYIGQMDVVIGNPPYVRPRNADGETRRSLSDFQFCNGTTDLYIAFFEMGIQMLSPRGTLCFITPNSFLCNTSQKTFRQSLAEQKLITDIFDFKFHQVFPNAATYTCITTLRKGNENDMFAFSTYGEGGENLQTANQKYAFQEVLDPKNTAFALPPLPTTGAEQKTVGEIARVQHGVATNLDRVFIGRAYMDPDSTTLYIGKHTDAKTTVYFNGHPIESSILRRAVKASRFHGRYKGIYIIFPYLYIDGHCKPIEEDALLQEYPMAYAYLLEHKPQLIMRDLDRGVPWYAFARSQGLNSMNMRKLTIRNFVAYEASEIECFPVPEDVVVYGGIFASGREDDLHAVRDALANLSNVRSCLMRGAPKRGGYVAITAKTVKTLPIN